MNDSADIQLINFAICIQKLFKVTGKGACKSIICLTTYYVYKTKEIVLRVCNRAIECFRGEDHCIETLTTYIPLLIIYVSFISVFALKIQA